MTTKSRRQPRILLIYTGGTIGMVKNRETGALEAFNFEHITSRIPELSQFDYDIRVKPFFHPIDSSDMKPEAWVQMAQIIENDYHNFDGFVILHGTDTMAYTASALSFMFENLSKPVILTGSQLPIGLLRTDGKENLITSIEIAAAQTLEGKPIVPEVCIFFDQNLYRGNRTTKFSSEEFNAFRSNNFPSLAQAGVDITYRQDLIIYPTSERPFHVNYSFNTGVLAITLFPGLRQELVEHIFSHPLVKAIILRTYGTGNAPQEKWLTDAVHNASEAGKVIVNITQCPTGSVEMGRYETGRQLREAGAISGHDMTIEAAITKLMCLLGRYNSPYLIRQLMVQSLAGEIGD